MNPGLLTQTFTHRSYLQRPVVSFLDPSQPRDYESLEHLGDSVLNLGVTDLLRQLYPDLRPGGATVSKLDSLEVISLLTGHLPCFTCLNHGWGYRCHVITDRQGQDYQQ